MTRPHKDFETFEAAELYCPRCRGARRVRERLLLVLPTGNKYEYLCADCSSSLGSREDGDARSFTVLAGPKPERP